MANMASTLKALNSLGFKLPEALARSGSSGKSSPRPARNTEAVGQVSPKPRTPTSSFPER